MEIFINSLGIGDNMEPNKKSMTEIMEQMKGVQERGLFDGREVKKSPGVINESNSLSNAMDAYKKMTGQSQTQKQPIKEETKDPLKTMGALQAMKEIIEEDNGVSKKNANEKLVAIRKILEQV
jgi:carboxypeptidase C (cathepsin A)